MAAAVLAAAIAMAAPADSGAASAADEHSLRTVLARAAAYVLEYQKQLSAIVAEETYVQETIADPVRRAPGRLVLQRRELKSDLLIVRVEGGDRWLQHRDVFEVDGRPVRDREERLSRLFLGPGARGPSLVGLIRRESARYNIGDVERTMNVPVLPLAILDPAAQPGFRFRREAGADAARAGEALPASPHFKVTTEVWVVGFEERRRPTLVRTPEGRDIFSRGRFWIEPATGRVLMCEMITASSNVRAELQVSYQSEPLLGLLVPVEMRERYTTRGRRAPAIEGTATYGRFRQFQVTVDEQIGPLTR